MSTDSVKSMLSGYDVVSAFGGALRFLESTDMDWIRVWGESSGLGLPKLTFFASDAFGVLYGLDEAGGVSILWTETGQVEALNVSEDDFYRLIAQDPDGTISLNLYEAACSQLHTPKIHQHFGFKVETALGGALDPSNLYIVDRRVHLEALGKIAAQISKVPVGTRLKVVK